MRILMCNYEYPPVGGGGGVVMAWLAEELARRHEVTVLTSCVGDLPRHEDKNGVEVIRVPIWFRTELQHANLPSMLAYVPSALAAGRKLKSRGFQLINSHFAIPSGPAGVRLSRLWRVPQVLSVHGGDLYDPSKRMSPHRHALLRATVRRIARASDAVVAQSHDTASNLQRYFTPEIQPSIIPLGIPRPRLPQRDRAALGIPEDAFVMVAVGRLVARKAMDRLIHVFARADIPNGRLIVIGDGPERPGLEAVAAALGLGERVKFLGFASEESKYRHLASADVYASTSLHEGFGLVFLEGAAAGLPVICYNRGGQSDFLTDGRTGYLLPVGDEAGMADRLRRLANEPDLRATLSAGAREIADDFMIDRCASQYETLFADLIRRHSHKQVNIPT